MTESIKPWKKKKNKKGGKIWVALAEIANWYGLTYQYSWEKDQPV